MSVADFGTVATVEREQLQQFLSAGAQLVEVLPQAEYLEQHLPGALNLPLKELNRASASHLDPTRPVIVYCHDGT